MGPDGQGVYQGVVFGGYEGGRGVISIMGLGEMGLLWEENTY